MSDLQDAVAKLSLGPNDILIVDGGAFDYESLARLRGPYPNPFLIVLPQPGKTARETFDTIDRESAVNFLKACVERL